MATLHVRARAPRRTVTTCALATLLAASPGCDRPGLGPSDTQRLALSGTVSASNGAPISGATVRVIHRGATGGSSFFVAGTGKVLAEAVTVADGSYAVPVPPPPGYAAPNCYVMSVEASAPGFAKRVATIEDPDASGGTCKSRRGRANVTLLPWAPAPGSGSRPDR